MTLNIHVNKLFFNMFLHGYKTHDYRECSSYWKERLERLRKDETVIIVERYSHNLIGMKFVSLSKVTFNKLPEYAKTFFLHSGYQYFYDIELKKQFE